MDIYPEEEYEQFIAAGKIQSNALTYGRDLIKIGASLLDVTEKVEARILDLGGEFAFPPQISLNKIAAHYCAEPEDETVFEKGDLAKIDVGVMVDGCVADAALTVDMGDNKGLVEASEKALAAAIEKVAPGAKLGEIGRTIQETIQNSGFSPVKNLSGHGVGRYIFHGKPSIPNYDTNDKTELVKGQVIAIEPFATDGMGMIYDSGAGNIFAQISRKPVRNMITRNVLKEIQTYNGMPFTTRWLTKKFPEMKVNYALRELTKLGIVDTFPPLPERKGGMVSQAEHTIIVDDPVIVTTKR